MIRLTLEVPYHLQCILIGRKIAYLWRDLRPVRNESKVSGSWSMLAYAIGDCKIDVFIRVVEATEKGNDLKVLYIHVLMDLPNGDLIAAGAIYCAVKRAVCSMAH